VSGGITASNDILGHSVTDDNRTQGTFPNNGAADCDLVRAWNIREVARVPRGRKRRTTGTDDQQACSRTHCPGAAADGRFGDRKGCAAIETSNFPVEFEDRPAFENEVQLLLAARALVVLFHKRLAGAARDEEVNAEGVDPERTLERVPHRVVWLAI
jgi:hypothetical protein